MLICLCCGDDVPPGGRAERRALPFYSRCVSETCRYCRSWVRVRKWELDPTYNLIGRLRYDVEHPEPPEMRRDILAFLR